MVGSSEILKLPQFPFLSLFPIFRPYCSASRDADETPELAKLDFQPRRMPGKAEKKPVANGVTGSPNETKSGASVGRDAGNRGLGCFVAGDDYPVEKTANATGVNDTDYNGLGLYFTRTFLRR